MTHFTFIRYFAPDSNEFAPGWYQTRNEGRTRIGDVPLSLSDALYDGPNRVLIDDNTPEADTPKDQNKNREPGSLVGFFQERMGG